MAKKAWLLSLITLLVISLGFLTLKSFGKDQKTAKTEDTGAISGKIDEVLKNQQDIIERLKDIRAQQDIIRVRASQK